MAADTQLAVVEAAAALFAERGWSGTGMRDIARAAGVSVETVYGSGGSKAQLLLRAIDIGVVGDDAPVPLADRPEFQALGAGEDRNGRLLDAARLVSEQYARVAKLHRTLESGAIGDEDLAGKLDEVRARQRTSFGEALALILGRHPAPELVDGIQAIGSPEVYLLLVHATGWSSQHYEEWLAQTWFRLLDHIPEERS
jgi:AcrR family transcriptional regulator